MKLIFFGTRKHGFESLKAIIEAGHHVSCVTTWDYGMDEVTSKDFQALCSEHSIPLHITNNIDTREWSELYKSYGADLGVCVGWRRLVQAPTLETTSHGFIGPHGADLPRYRGFASTHYSILNGDPYCGFCIMLFKPGVADNGDICRRFQVPLDENTTIADLLERSRPLVVENILATIADLERGELKPEPQEETLAVLSYPRLPRDGEIDWNRPAEEIHRLVRTVTRPYPGAYSFFQGEKMYIWRSRLLRKAPRWVGQPGHVIHLDNEIGVLTGEGILILEECQIEGHPSVHPRDLFYTFRLRLGLDASSEIMELKDRVAALEERLSGVEFPKLGVPK